MGRNSARSPDRTIHMRSSAFKTRSRMRFQDIIENQAVSDAALLTLSVLYSLVIFGSVVGNTLVITAVLKAPNMRKVRREKSFLMHAASLLLSATSLFPSPSISFSPFFPIFREIDFWRRLYRCMVEDGRNKREKS